MSNPKVLSHQQQELVQFFPEGELPVMLSQDQVKEFSDYNDPFPQKFIEEILMAWEKEVDEFTEFIPCLRLPVQENYIAVVYWKGGLLKYEFILVTLDKQGQVISRKPIATTLAEDNQIKQSAAYIDEEMNITILAGQNLDGDLYDSSLSQKFSMEILFNGEIVLDLDA